MYPVRETVTGTPPILVWTNAKKGSVATSGESSARISRDRGPCTASIP